MLSIFLLWREHASPLFAQGVRPGNISSSQEDLTPPIGVSKVSWFVLIQVALYFHRNLVNAERSK